MADFLLELLSEEIPARMQEKASADLARLFGEELARAGLKPDSLTSYVTPRRLALIARGLPLETTAVSEEIKGPKASAPPQALEGFLRKTGLAREQLVERDGILFAVVEKPGRATADVLAEAIPAIIRGFPWPKSMRWGTASQSTAALRWVRPLQGIVALLGDDVVAIEVDGIVSGAATMGHRFHHPGQITIGNADDYVAKLRACHVIVDHAERRDIIRARTAELAAEAGLTVVPDEGLVAENAGLTEWPVPLLGHFDPAFLDVPREVIQLTLRTNQKYFVLNDAAGKLAPAFICTANITAKDGGVGIVAGNGKVLAARLSDAKFFWQQDLDSDLDSWNGKLPRIVYHERLGSIWHRVARIQILAEWLRENAIPADKEDVRRAALLSKADLVSQMVGEFPELQGIMGGYYVRSDSSFNDAVADAIRDQYRPIGPADSVPSAPVSVILALAEKLDSIISFFSIDQAPTGSKDPFALRRAALGIIRLLIENNTRVSLRSIPTQYYAELIRDIDRVPVDQSVVEEHPNDQWFDGWRSGNPIFEGEGGPSHLVAGHEVRLRTELRQQYRAIIALSEKLFSSPPDHVAFLADRLKVQQREAGVRHDLIDAVFALGGEDDLVRLLARVKALQAFVETEDGANLLAGYKRAANILKKESPSSVTPAGVSRGEGAAPSQEMPASAGMTEWGYEPEAAEQALADALDTAESNATAAIQAEDFAAAMSALATLRGPIDAFFDKVTVNDADPVKRTTRLALLEKIRAAVHNVADFSKIEG
ncbi:glycine--tRNA ligase subunit beta [Rhizorhabdus argentea]|uniref:glycine--tRNA ligase subunit beta n=1 Tax=Rhizorhabdus argentea TaxID=1387174 RepID=UPI0030EC2098